MCEFNCVSSNRPLAIGYCLFLLMFSARCASGDTILLDDFNDGDAGDGIPIAWTPGIGTWDASSGDYIATGPIPRVSLLPEVVLGDTSTRAQVRVDGNIGASLAIRRPSPLTNPLVGYAGQILPEGTNGRVAIVRLDGAPIPNVLGRAPMPFSPIQQDVMIQFDAFGDELSLWAWPVGEPMPVDPQLEVVDDTYAEGAVGLVAARAGGDPSASATFRFFQVADTHITHPTSLAGDFDGNAVLAIDDLDLLAAEIQNGTSDDSFDLNNDSVVDFHDQGVWVKDLARTFFGDSNFDGEFNSRDLVDVFQAGEYEDSIQGNSTWATGDWNADGEFTSGDLVVAFQDGGFEQGPREAVSAVPEPNSLVLLQMALVAVAAYTRTRSKAG